MHEIGNSFHGFGDRVRESGKIWCYMPSPACTETVTVFMVLETECAKMEIHRPGFIDLVNSDYVKTVKSVIRMHEYGKYFSECVDLVNSACVKTVKFKRRLHENSKRSLYSICFLDAFYPNSRHLEAFYLFSR